MEEQLKAFFLSFILWDLVVYFVGFAEPDTETIACHSQNGFVAAHAIRRWIPTWTKPISNETAAQLDEDWKAQIDSSEDIQAISYHTQVSICYWLANTYISCTEFEIDETAVVTHFSRGLIANICVEGVLMIWYNNFGCCLHI